MSYISLKSGTDIRGVASPLGGKEVNLTGGFTILPPHLFHGT